jgi:hypothetical protein
MQEFKPFWASKTLWVNAIALIASVGGTMVPGFDIDPEAQVAIVGGLMAIINIFLRFKTTMAVGG